MKRGKLWIGILALGVALWWAFHRSEQPAEVGTKTGDESLLVNRLWVDRIPQRETDKFHIFAVITRHPVGVFQHGSLWEGQWAMFQWQFKGADKDLQIRFPQDGKKATIQWKVRDCGQAPFHYCMTMKGNPRGPEKWYSRKDWVIGSVTDISTLKEQLQAEK